MTPIGPLILIFGRQGHPFPTLSRNKWEEIKFGFIEDFTVSFTQCVESAREPVNRSCCTQLYPGYIFGTTASEDDAADKRKYDEIMEDMKPLLADNPDYKIYVTGHSLGAALSTIVAFYLACEDDAIIPKPVTCINFASPRVGDYYYLQASTALESLGKLRFLRVVNDHDSIAMVPIFNYYHAGFQIRLSKDSAAKEEPEVTYPKLVDSYSNRWARTWGNSVFASFNLSYDHGDYRERVEQNKEALEKMELNTLYGDEALTGFSVAA